MLIVFYSTFNFHPILEILPRRKQCINKAMSAIEFLLGRVKHLFRQPHPWPTPQTKLEMSAPVPQWNHNLLMVHKKENPFMKNSTVSFVWASAMSPFMALLMVGDNADWPFSSFEFCPKNAYFLRGLWQYECGPITDLY